MSSRAIRRLREEREGFGQVDVGLDEDGGGGDVHDEDDDEPISSASRSKTAFLVMMDSSDEDDEEEEEQTDEEVESQEDDLEPVLKDAAPLGDKNVKPVPETPPLEEQKLPADEKKQDDEDLDAILAEFQSQDAQTQQGETSDLTSSFLPVLLQNFEKRDLDMNYVMRTSLLSGDSEAVASRPSSRRTQQFLFGAPNNEWVRPPHYVGGGIGMSTYDALREDKHLELPWPYSREESEWKDLKQWYAFQYSDTYRHDLEDYKRIQESGDVNALALFVAHHPFVVEALLQLSTVLYNTNQNQEGLSVLRRALWICECSSLSSFTPGDRQCVMDYEREENKPFFMALFRLMQVSSIAGCMRTSLAVSRYLLSLDPSRDLMGMLPILDYFALSTMNEQHDRFLVELVESEQIQIHFKDITTTRKKYCGGLLDLPNWSYSYALALYRMNKDSQVEDLRTRADDALQQALRKFPSILEQILDKNEVDTTARSFRADWPAVLGPIRKYADLIQYTAASGADETILRHASLAAIGLLTRIFLDRNAKLWSGDDTLLWMYQNCETFAPDATSSVHLSPAVIRYSQCDPSDYEDRFRTLPNDVNPLDPGLLAPALAVDPNRRRFLVRRPNVPRGADGNEGVFGGMFADNMRAQPHQMHMIDPDDPMLEVFWRSLLPWNHVEGVPPPRR